LNFPLSGTARQCRNSHSRSQTPHPARRHRALGCGPKATTRNLNVPKVPSAIIGVAPQLERHEPAPHCAKRRSSEMGTGPTKLSVNFRASDEFDPRFTSQENAYQVYDMESCFPGRQHASQSHLNKYSCKLKLDDSNDCFQIELSVVGTTGEGGTHRASPFLAPHRA